MKKSQVVFWAFALCLSPIALKEVYSKMIPQKHNESVGAFTLHSSGFENGKPIPSKFTYDGENVSPELKWTDPPPAAKTLALINDDPDAPRGDWVHWVLINIPASLRELKEGISNDELKALGIVEGTTDFGRPGYDGPAPPSGTHRYFFKLYALDAGLTLPARATKADLLRAMKGHVLAEAKLMGTYRR